VNGNAECSTTHSRDVSLVLRKTHIVAACKRSNINNVTTTNLHKHVKLNNDNNIRSSSTAQTDNASLVVHFDVGTVQQSAATSGDI